MRRDRRATRLLLLAALAAAACKGERRGPTGRASPLAELRSRSPAAAAAAAAAPAGGGKAVPAFRGAEGFGATTPGGRGGRVLRVTTLADDGPGSLRAALAARGPRVVVFAISGVIDSTLPLCIDEPWVTVAGQTAPGDGIMLAGEELRVRTHDVVLRHLRVRTGDARVPHDGWEHRDAVDVGAPQARDDVHDVVLDHCSLGWSVGETLAIRYGAHDVTVQRCLLAEPLCRSRHPDGPHSMGILVGEGCANVSLHHDLIADSDDRNPQVGGAGVVDIRNVVVFDWGESAALFRGRGNRINFVANWYQRGPDSTKAWARTAIRVKDDARDLALFVAGNVDPTSASPDADDWTMVSAWNGRPLPDETLRAGREHPCPAVTTTTAAAAYASVLDDCGATRPRRDAADARVVAGVRSGIGRIIDSEQEVGGWPELASAPAPADADGDGMPDAWERAHGLDPDDPSDAARDVDGDGWTSLDDYLDELAR